MFYKLKTYFYVVLKKELFLLKYKNKGVFLKADLQSRKDHTKKVISKLIRFVKISLLIHAKYIATLINFPISSLTYRDFCDV